MSGARRGEDDDGRVVFQRVGGSGRDRVFERAHGRRRGGGVSVPDGRSDTFESERLAGVVAPLEHSVGEQQQALAGVQVAPVDG